MIKGFTLIELLIVIGILAILATTVVLVLNPAQILQESRDTQRLTDFGTLQSAIALYLSTAITPSIGGAVCGTDWWVTIPTGSGTFAVGDQPFVNPVSAKVPAQIASPALANGTGWMRIDFSSTPDSGISNLPVDPTNATANENPNVAYTAVGSADRFYAYGCRTTGGVNQYKITANLESPKHSPKEGTDGGTQANLYEVGINMSQI